MRVVAADSNQRSRWRPSTESAPAARVERIGMLVVSVVLLLGVWLTYVEQTSESAAAGGSSAQEVVNLNTLADAAVLTPFLTQFTPGHERTVVADAIRRYVTQADRPLQHVGALAAIRMPSRLVAGDARLPVLQQRVRGRAGADDVALLSAVDLALLKPHVVVRTRPDYRRQIATAVGLFLAAFWLAHVVRWLSATTGDPILLPSVQLLTGIGLMAMIALRDPLRDMVLAAGVARGIAAGCAIWTAVAFIDFESPRLRRAVLAPLSAAVLLAAALLAFGSGPAGSGAKVNLLGVQPVEVIRLLVVFSLAGYFARRWQFLREFSDPVTPARGWWRHVQLPRWKDARPLAVSIGTVLVFFFLQKDLGPALVIACVFLGLYGIARGRVALVVGGFCALIGAFAVGYALGVPATVTRRVQIWLDPWNNGLARGDQISHALWALASGGVWGAGPGVGDPQVIPAGHTDLVVAALGEELGLIGVVALAVVFALIIWRLLRVALRAPGDYSAFLVTGLALAISVQAIVIVGGLLGLLPLAGVVTPFLSYGRSSMLSNFAAVAVCAAISRRVGPVRPPFAAPMRVLGGALAGAAVVLVCGAAAVQAVRADAVAVRANLAEQADGGYRYQYNPRLTAAARRIERGTIFDRSGLPLATSRPGELAKFTEAYRRIGVTLPGSCTSDERARCYPLGGLAFHLLGDAGRQTNWAARNASFAEKDFDGRLKGYDDKPQTVEIRVRGRGSVHTAVTRDYTELLPLVRHKGNSAHPKVRQLLGRSRDVHLTVDAGLQASTAKAMRRRAEAAGAKAGAAVIIDPASGDLLASISYPWPDGDGAEQPIASDRLLDRARYGLYPPGSTFKLVTAVAALRVDPAEQHSTVMCVRLPDGRVGSRVAGANRPIRDDPLDHDPHGRVDMHRGLVVSCNAYFAALAQRIGPKALGDAAADAQIAAATPPVTENLRGSLPYAGYGQGAVVASPLRMARVAAAIASDGMLRGVRVAQGGAAERDVRWVSAGGAALMRRYMREAVTSGTGRVLASHPVAIAGKTGTAEVDQAASHSWFTGFAPAGQSRRRIAFAVIVEHAGYGARVAAPIAGDIVSAAQARQVIR